eukprot:GFUD01019190.1.p1 GENE.GFUD01019190.1~~GFUD01019190.1.p1  ORF type:complete len:950 (+),score=341.68 GFUD01019190.1:50-2851(+)
MEGLGAEVSAKIRSAIKAKLIELEAYVDDELPDYIMVMVANNRTKEQMEEDLGLFLNNNCGAFTNWLHAVLEKLKKVTLEEVTKKDSKKKKVKKVSDKSSKKVLKDNKERARDTKDRDRKSKPEKLEKKSSRSSHKSIGEKSKSEKNANLEELGERKRKKPVSLDDSGGKDGYDPESLLKSAIDKSKKKGSPRKSSGKRASKKESSKRDDSDAEFENDMKSSKSKTIINLKEEADFYAAKRDKREDLKFEIKSRGEREGRSKMHEERVRSRSPKKSTESKRENRSLSKERSRGLASLVSKVVKPSRADRQRSRSLSSVSDVGYDPELLLKRSLVSRAMVPPRPSRPAGREEKGVARAVNRAIMDADRSIMRSKRRESREREVERYPRDLDMREEKRDDPRDKDVRWEGRDRSVGERGERGGFRNLEEWRRRDRDRPDRAPRLSPDDIQRYEFLKKRHKEVEERRIEEKAVREQRQRERDLRDRQKEDQARMSRKVSGGSRLEERSGRRLAMDVEIEKNVRASSLDRKLLKRREERRGLKEEELRIIVRRDESNERDVSPESPPRQRKLEDDDAELLEMRRKALESLMKRTDKELVRSRSRSRDRKIIIPLGEASSEESDDSDTTESDESDISLSDVEELQGKVKDGKEKSSKPEPTFIVTMDGIDDKYFKKGTAPITAPMPNVKKEKEVKEPQSKTSSDAELELHPNEDFDEAPKKKVAKKIPEAKSVHKEVKKGKQERKPDPSKKPTMKVAARKRSPILPPTDTPQQVAAVQPISAAKPPTKNGSAAKLAASYAAQLTSIKAAKAEAAAAAKPPTPQSPKVRMKTIPTKPPAANLIPTSPAKPKVKRTPIQAPSPEPFSKPVLGISRMKSAPSGLSFPTTIIPKTSTLPQSSSTCKFWPNCSRKDACAFYHPPVMAPKSAEPLGSKYKWSAT